MAQTTASFSPLPDTIVQDDVAARAPLERLAACHALLSGMAAGAELAPLWHWLHFLDAAPAADLGADGHRRRGTLVPHDPALPARMWAGGRLHFLTSPAPGTPVRRETRLAGVTERQGRTGRLRFVTLRHAISGVGEMLTEEEQDLVFRVPAAPRPPVPAPPAPSGAVIRAIVPDAVLLFRFSALTYNAHRIHYDADYAAAEHYSGLVVHGPLQVVLLAAMVPLAAPGAVLRRLDFRGLAPAFAGRTLTLEAWRDPAQADTVHLQTRGEAGALCMEATAHTEEAPA